MVKYTVEKYSKNYACPNVDHCIGFSTPVQTDTGVFPCKTVYDCPFANEDTYKWKPKNEVDEHDGL